MIKVHAVRFCYLFALLLLLCTGCNSRQALQPTATATLTGPYFGQNPPGESPQLFAPAVFREEIHGAPVFSVDGKEVYWSLHSAKLLCSRLVDDTWTSPSALAFSQLDDSPVFSADGSKLYFLSQRASTKASIWMVERQGSGWSSPVILPEAVNVLEMHWQIGVAPNGDLYFGGQKPSSGGDQDIYCAKFVDGKYSSPVKLSDSVNSDAGEHSPHIAMDGSYLLFSRVDKARTNADLWVSFRAGDGSWQKAVRLPAPVNSSTHDQCARVSPDGKYLFFSSTRGGGTWQVYWVDAQVIEDLRPR